MTGRRAYVAVAASGIALSFAFPEPSVAPLAWICLAPLLLTLRDAGTKRGFRLGFTFGVAYFGALLYWISIIGVIAWILLTLMQACFLGVFGAIWGRISNRAQGWERIVLPAAIWVVIVEYLRAVVPVTAFTWGELAQSQHNVEWLLRAASVGGGWLVALLLVTVNALWAEAFVSRKHPKRTVLLALSAIVILAAPIIIPQQQANGDSYRIAIVQGNVPRYVEPSYDKDLTILNSHVALTRELPDDVDLVVWPESAVAEDPFRRDDFALALAVAARSAGAPMIVGATIDRDDDRYQVMALQISPEGQIVDQYQKTHLVPFGEFVPARRFLDWIPALDQVPRDAVPGDEPKIFKVDGYPIATVISFEGDFGSLVRGRIAGGGRLLIVATNTSTWGDSWASAQHVAMSQVRAAENGVYVAHGALSGISAFISPTGTILDATDLWTADTLIHDVNFADSVTLYARLGDWVPLMSLIVWLGLHFNQRRRAMVL